MEAFVESALGVSDTRVPGPLRILVLGVGGVGADVACGHALAGHEVAVWDPEPDAVQRRVSAAFARAREIRSCSGADVEQATARLRHVADGASADCDVVVEDVAEDLELKGQLLGRAGETAAHALLVTCTSLLRVTDVGRAAGASHRTVGMRYARLIAHLPFVEVAPGERTAPWCVEVARELATATGWTPLVLGRDVRGSASDRLQLALVRECAFLVEQGVISREGVDEVVREGLARRWRHVGPLRALVLGGFDTWNALVRNIAPELSNASEIPSSVER